MKKYLMTGIAAVAMCAAFTSCSKNDADLYNPDEIAQNEFEAKIARYNEAFINTFGQPAATQDWGFGNYFAKSARTRATIDPNGNMWPYTPTVGSTERNDVYTYVNSLSTKSKVIPSDLSTYFVTHIYKGSDTHGSYNYSNDLMNQLEFAESAPASISWDGQQQGSWFHVYDFNSALSTDYEGNMLVINTPPLNFAYKNSADSKWHDKWIGVDGANIPKTGGGNYAGNYYICFDFEAMPNEVVTVFEMPEHNGAKVNVPGYWKNKTGQDLINAGIRSITVPATEWSEEATYTVQANWFATQVQYENMYAPGDDNYTDWIIRLVKAEGDEPQDNVVRVIAEDMAGYAADDFDFNDVVFDCELDENEYVTKITLIHTGAEFSITVDGQEVHEKFGLPKNANRPVYWTMGSGNYSFTPSKATYKVDDIPVIVTQIIEVQGENGTIEYKEKKITLTAPTGFTTGKLAVGRDFGIVPERQNIDTYTKGKFSTYVQNGGVWNQWYK